MNLEKAIPPSKELEIMKIEGEKYEIAVTYNQRMFQISSGDIRYPIYRIGFERLIQNILYLNANKFHINPIVREDKSYYYKILMPIEFKDNFLTQLYLQHGATVDIFFKDQVKFDFQGCELNFGLVNKMTFFGGVIDKELTEYRKGIPL